MRKVKRKRTKEEKSQRTEDGRGAGPSVRRLSQTDTWLVCQLPNAVEIKKARQTGEDHGVSNTRPSPW